jgi:DNA-binding Lrp family transcriptional regulator
MSQEINNGKVNGKRKSVIIVKYSNNAVIDQIYDLEKDGPAFSMGHYIPDIWTRIFLDDRGRPHWLAMIIFAEIWFRHRPIQDRQIRENGDKVITLSKGFSADHYQFNREEMASRLNTSADAISRVLTYLVKLGVIDRDHADTDFNHRGFRNLVYVTPIVDKLLELISESEKVVNKNEPIQEIDENTHDSERRDVGNVTHMMPATLPTSSRQRGPHDVGNVAPMMGVVSRESSQITSVSAVIAAEPQHRPETNNNKNPSAPQAAQPACAGDDSLEDWEAPPPKPTGKNGAVGSMEEKVKTIRYRIGKYYQTWYEHKPDLSAKEFEELLMPVIQELRWKVTEIITVILAGWLWADDAPEKEPGKTFIAGFYSKKCKDNLQALFLRDRKERKSYLWHIREELESQAGNEYDIEVGNMTRQDADDWWKEEMLKRRVIRDASKYYDEKGRNICDPDETTWTGIKNELDRWHKHNDPGRKPEQTWIKSVIERFKRESDPPKIHRSDYEDVKNTLKTLELFPADFP